MILSRAHIIDANLYSLRCKTTSLNPATIVWVYDFISLIGYGVTFLFLFTQYKILSIACGEEFWFAKTDTVINGL
jgi:hypothetical protein